MQRKYAWLGIIAIVFIAPNFITVVSALTESAPSLIWTQNDFGGGAAARVESDRCWQTVAAGTRGTGMIDVDWLTGDAYFAHYLDVTTPATLTVSRLRSASGIAVWPTLPVLQPDGVLTQSGICGIAADQRGRVYVALDRGGGTSTSVTDQIASKILRKDTGEVVGLFSPSNNGHAYAWDIDLLSDVDNENPNATLWGGWAHMVLPDGAASYSERCSTLNMLTVGAPVSSLTWRMDGTQGVGLLSGPDGANTDIGNFAADDCTHIADVGTTYDTAVVDLSKTAWRTSELHVFGLSGGQPGTNYLLSRFDGGDTSDPMTAIGTKTIPAPAEFAANVGAEIYGFEYAADGNPLVCGKEFSGGEHFFGRIDYDADAFEWYIKVSDEIEGCKLGMDGAVYIYGEVAGASPADVYVKKYCCITSETIHDLDVAQLDFGDDGGGDESGNTVRFAVDFCSDAWGVDCGWLFGLGIVGMVTVAFAGATRSPVAIAAAIVIGIIVSFGLGLFPIWVVFVMVLLMLLVAGVFFFGNGDSD